jgi:hypothetical protein
MRNLFFTIIAIDVLILAIPTAWMGARVEFWTAVSLAVVTGLLWLVVRAGYGEQ